MAVLVVAAGYAAAGPQVVVPPQRCPGCLRRLVGWGGYWRWLRAPLLVERIWIRRGRCSVCRRSHALLPDLVLARRLDEVDAIGRGLAQAGRWAGAAADRRATWRAAHDGSGVVATFRVWSPTMLTQCTALAVSLDVNAVVLDAVGDRAALDALGVAWQRAQARFGNGVGGLWAFWSRVAAAARRRTQSVPSVSLAALGPTWRIRAPPGHHVPDPEGITSSGSWYHVSRVGAERRRWTHWFPWLPIPFIADLR